MVALMRVVLLLAILIISLQAASISGFKSVIRTANECDKVNKECIAKCEHYCHDLGMEPFCEYNGEKVGCICVCHHGH